MHRNKFALNKPEPAVKITRNDKDPINFTVVINDVSILTLDTKAFKNVDGLTWQVDHSRLTINVTPSKQFDVCDGKFRNFLGKLNSENCGLLLRDLDNITKAFNDFLHDHNIHSKFTGGLRLSSERQTPGNNMAF